MGRVPVHEVRRDEGGAGGDHLPEMSMGEEHEVVAGQVVDAPHAVGGRILGAGGRQTHLQVVLVVLVIVVLVVVAAERVASGTPVGAWMAVGAAPGAGVAAAARRLLLLLLGLDEVQHVARRLRVLLRGQPRVLRGRREVGCDHTPIHRSHAAQGRSGGPESSRLGSKRRAESRRREGGGGGRMRRSKSRGMWGFVASRGVGVGGCCNWEGRACLDGREALAYLGKGGHAAVLSCTGASSSKSIVLVLLHAFEKMRRFKRRKRKLDRPPSPLLYFTVCEIGLFSKN